MYPLRRPTSLDCYLSRMPSDSFLWCLNLEVPAHAMQVFTCRLSSTNAQRDESVSAGSPRGRLTSCPLKYCATQCKSTSLLRIVRNARDPARKHFFGNLRTMRQRHCSQRPFNSNTRPQNASVARPYHRPALRPNHYFTENSMATDCCPCVAIGRHSLPRADFAFLKKTCYSWS
jgi:hypothetical protein